MFVNESNIKFNGLKYGNNPKEIIIHNADHPNCTVYDIDRWHKNNGWSGIGYQYFIRKNGEIWRGRPENAIGAHTVDHNSKSIGICLEGSFNKENPSAAQLNSLKELILDIRKRRGNISIYGHKDFNNTDCPGKNFPLKDVKNMNFTVNVGSNNIESNNSNSNNEGENEEMKKYKNGSTIEYVYSDNKFQNKVGSLNAYEECSCICLNNDIIVYYNVYSGGMKTGFVKWRGGVQ